LGVTLCAQALHAAPPARAFADLPPGFTRTPEGVTPPSSAGGKDLPSAEIAHALTAEQAREFRARATADAGVKQLLGDRFVFIYDENLEPPKGQKRNQVEAKLTFFSYSSNSAVEVVLRGGVVVSAEKTGLFPTEGDEEINQAIALASKHPTLAGRVAGLDAGAMMAQPVPRTRPAWLGNRVLDVRFFDVRHVSRFMALVDLTTESVLQAGPVD
jgi:hypothetical protein